MCYIDIYIWIDNISVQYARFGLSIGNYGKILIVYLHASANSGPYPLQGRERSVE